MSQPTFTLKPAPFEPPDTQRGDPRIAHLLGQDLAEGDTPRLVLLGFPVDEGVRRNQGRTGAAAGPSALRERFLRLCPDPENLEEFSLLIRSSRDLGDIECSGDLAQDQQALGSCVSAQLEAGSLVVILGGGHETGYGHFLAYARRGKPVAIQNFDAHADVRPLRDGHGHSGSPFRQALTHPSGCCTDYQVAGLQPSATAADHLEFLRANRAGWTWREDTDRPCIDSAFAGDLGPRMATFCLDAVDQAFAPGVSAPACGGMHPDLWLYAAEGAGRCTDVRSLDIVELNPGLDRDGQTARLAALTLWHFLRGVALR